MSSFTFEDLASFLNECASRLPKLLAVGNDVEEVLLIVWKVIVDGLKSANDEIEDLKRVVEESLEKARKYRNMCAKAAQGGCKREEIKRIKQEIQLGNFSTLCSYVSDMIQLLNDCASRFVDFKSASNLAKRRLQAAASEATERQATSQKGVRDSGIATAAGIAGALAGIGIGIPLSVIFAPVGIPILIAGIGSGAAVTIGGSIGLGVHASNLFDHTKALKQICLLDTPLTHAEVIIAELETRIAPCWNYVSNAHRGKQRAVDRGKVSQRTIWLIENALDKIYNSLVFVL